MKERLRIKFKSNMNRHIPNKRKNEEEQRQFHLFAQLLLFKHTLKLISLKMSQQ